MHPKLYKDRLRTQEQKNGVLRVLLRENDKWPLFATNIYFSLQQAADVQKKCCALIHTPDLQSIKNNIIAEYIQMVNERWKKKANNTEILKKGGRSEILRTRWIKVTTLLLHRPKPLTACQCSKLQFYINANLIFEILSYILNPFMVTFRCQSLSLHDVNINLPKIFYGIAPRYLLKSIAWLETESIGVPPGI